MHVPCIKRVKDMENGLDEKIVDGEEGWFEAKSNTPRIEPQEISDMNDIDHERSTKFVTGIEDEVDFIPDMHDDNDNNDEQEVFIVYTSQKAPNLLVRGTWYHC